MRRLCLLLVTLMSCAAWSQPTAEPGPGLSHLQTWMSGAFSSAAQAAADSDYFHIRLHMSPVWTQRTDGPWLYVEQAVAAAADKPYRQRVYRLREVGGSRFISEVHELPEPVTRFVGAWRNPASLDIITPDSLLQRKGCAVQLTWVESSKSYVGSTVDDACASSLRGAAYATSHVSINAEGINSWDRGYDDHGLQVWGATKGAYLFRREEE